MRSARVQSRIGGLVLSCLAIFGGYHFAYAFINSVDAASAFADLADMYGKATFDKTDFLLHWRVAYGICTILAALWLCAGIAMIFLKRWSWLVIAGAAGGCVVLRIVGVASGYLRYGFERGGLIPDLGLLILLVGALYGY